MKNNLIESYLTHRLFPDRPLPQFPADLDPAGFVKRLKQLQLIGVFSMLAEETPWLFPAEVQRLVKLQRIQWLFYGDAWIQHVSAVLIALNQNRIPFVVMKGWALIPSLYAGDYSLRFYLDIDILVAPQDVDRTQEALFRVGYVSPKMEPWPGYNRRFHYSLGFRPDGQLTDRSQTFELELHWKLLNLPYFDQRIRIDDLLARALPLQVGDQPAAQMAPEDHLVYSCAHLALHHAREDSLFRDFEIAAYLHQSPGLDWEVVFQRAEEWRLVQALTETLLRLERRWPGLLPSAVQTCLSALRPRWDERLVVSWFLNYHHNPTLAALLDWLTLPGVVTRACFLFETAFPNSDYLRWRYGGEEGASWFSLYMRRIQNFFSQITRS